MANIIILTKPYDFNQSLFPSLNYVLFISAGESSWRKIFGYKKGAIFTFYKNMVKYTKLNRNEALFYLGIWYDPHVYINDVEPKYIDIVDVLINNYLHVGIPIAPQDPHIIFIASFMNRITDYHFNVVKWVRKLLELSKENVKSIDSKLVNKVSSSFQVKELPQALKVFLSTNLNQGYWSLRHDLLKIKKVGPKVADLYLLHWRGFLEAVPVDAHLVKFLRNLNLIQPGFKLPQKNYCLMYRCDSCPNANCLGLFMREKFGKLAPWFQTISYIHDKIYCKKSLCNICSIKSICSKVTDLYVPL